MSVINRSFLQRRTERLLSENPSIGNTVGYAGAKKIGILFTQSDRNKYMAIRNLIKQLKNDNKQVEVLCFLEKGGENFDFLYDYITSSDVGLLGRMQSPSATKFSQTTFDYLFYLDLKENVYLENVLAMTKASCRIGFYNKNKDGLLDLMINTNSDSDIEEAVQMILYYTKKLGSDGNKI
jgi:hypothetical protein